MKGISLRDSIKTVPVVFALMLFLVSKTSLASCTDYGDYLHWGGRVELDAISYGIAVEAGYAYVANGEQGLKIVDTRDPSRGFVVGSMDIPGRAVNLAVSRGVAYVANDAGGVQIVDITDPGQPSLLSTLDTPGTPLDLTVEGSFLYIADGTGLQIADISDPHAPFLVSRFETPGIARSVQLQNAVACVACDLAGVQLIDVSDPQSPAFLESYSTPGIALNAVYTGGYIYVADGNAGLEVINTWWQQPGVIGSLVTGSRAVDLALMGHNLVVADEFYGLVVVDVTDPYNPAALGRVSSLSDIHSLAVDGSYCYVSDWSCWSSSCFVGGLVAFRIPSAESLEILGSVDTPGLAQGLAISAHYAYLASGDGGLQIIDVSNPALPSVIGSATVASGATDVAVSGSYAYVCAWFWLYVFNVSNAGTPGLVGRLEIPPHARGITVSGGFAYISAGLGGFHIVDISTPTSPRLLATLPTGSHAYQAAIRGSMAYLASGDSGVLVIDISNPSAPRVLGGVDTPGHAYGLALEFPFAYIADGYQGLQVVDVSNPNAPALVGHARTAYLATEVGAKGSSCYLADTFRDVEVFDISNPAVPTLMGEGKTDGGIFGIAVGDYVYVGDGGYGLSILPLHCSLGTPVRLLSFMASHQPHGILLEWVTAGESDVSGFHVHRSEHSEGDYERLTTELIGPSATYHFLDSDITPGMTYFYRLEAVDRTGGREYFGPVSVRVDPGLRSALGQAYPNPVRSGASIIPFTLSRPGAVKLTILDPAGREVRRLVDEKLGAGNRTVVWDGRDGIGAAVPAGIYFYRLAAQGFEATHKIVKLQ